MHETRRITAVAARLAVLLVSAVAFAASGAEPAPEKSHAPMHHPQANAAAIAFHDLMEQFWHAAPGAARNAKACSMSEEIVKRAKAAATRPTPEHGATIRSAQAFKEACAAKNEAVIGQEIDRMHELFYKIAG